MVDIGITSVCNEHVIYVRCLTLNELNTKNSPLKRSFLEKRCLDMSILKVLADFGYLSKQQKGTNSQNSVYCSPCPFCEEGNDRFIIWPESRSKRCLGRFWCRRCQKSGDTIDVYMKLKKFSNDFEAKKMFYQEYKDEKHLPPYKQEYRSTSLNSPTEVWQEKLSALIDMAHKNIWKEEDLLKKLEQRGLPEQAVKDFKLGYLSNKTTFNAQSLGYGADQKDITIFAGMVIPTFEPSGSLIRIKVRRLDWKPEHRLGKYLAVSGSMGGMNLIGSRKTPHVIAVESELDAYAVAHIAKDRALVVAVGSNTKNPDLATDFLVKKKDRLIVIYDNDEGGQAMLKKWKGL